jgi:hypothetical protein
MFEPAIPILERLCEFDAIALHAGDADIAQSVRASIGKSFNVISVALPWAEFVLAPITLDPFTLSPFEFPSSNCFAFMLPIAVLTGHSPGILDLFLQFAFWRPIVFALPPFLPISTQWCFVIGLAECLLPGLHIGPTLV